MAIFSGGKYIRRALLDAYNSSNESAPYVLDETNLCDSPLSFWAFDPSVEVEDAMKEEFKARVDNISGKLTSQEREGIVRESVRVFEMCERLVGALDEDFSGMDARQQGSGATTSTVQGAWAWLCGFRGSLALSAWGPPGWLRREVRVQS